MEAEIYPVSFKPVVQENRSAIANELEFETNSSTWKAKMVPVNADADDDFDNLDAFFARKTTTTQTKIMSSSEEEGN
jgi:hypothetical protein